MDPVTMAVASGIEPSDVLTAAGLALDVGQSAYNMRQQKIMNAQNRNFAREMYQRELMDKERQWQEVNRYNHPRQQMQRLKEAGLNPHLIYGKGADATAGQISGTSGKGATGIAPKLDTDFSGSLAKYVQLKNTEAVTDNIIEQKRVTQQEALLKAAQTLSALEDVKSKDFQNKVNIETRDQIIRATVLNNKLKEADITFRLDSNEREEIRVQLQEAQTNINKMVAKYGQSEAFQRITESRRRVQKMDAEEAGIMQNIKESNARIGNILQQTLTEENRTALTAEQKKQVEQAIKLSKQQETINRFNIWMIRSGIDPNSGNIATLFMKFVTALPRSFELYDKEAYK